MNTEQRQAFWNALVKAQQPTDSQMIGETIKYPEHIYRYRFPTMNSIAALMENKCFFSTSNYYDDPFDTYLHIDFNVVDDYVNQFFENPKQAFESAMQKKIEDDQDIDFIKSINREELVKWVREMFKGIRNDLRKQVHSICFSETPTNESLWLKYADSHKGFVIEYVVQNLHEKKIRGENGRLAVP